MDKYIMMKTTAFGTSCKAIITFHLVKQTNLNFTCSLVCDEVKIENVKSVLQDFIKRHSLVGFDVK